MTTAADAAPAPSSAFRTPGFRIFLLTFLLAMMADNIEHVISYWVAFQKFHSAALGGFAVVSHWLPFLMFSVPVGALNDRFDSRRLIQCGMVLFIPASAGWGYFFVTDSLEVWHAMVLLTLHGCAGVLWSTSSQMLLYDIVGPALAGQRGAAERDGALPRLPGGPRRGQHHHADARAHPGIFLNTVFYLPLLLWLMSAPYGRHFRGRPRAPSGPSGVSPTSSRRSATCARCPWWRPWCCWRGRRPSSSATATRRRCRASPRTWATETRALTYTLLLGADAAGALLAGILLETRGSFLRTEASSALKLAFLWGCALFAFSFMRAYVAAIVVLFLAGFLELSFSSMTQALVQLNAPDNIRGRVLGLFSMSASGLRAFSGVTVGLLGSVTNIHMSLALSAAAFVMVAGVLLFRRRQQDAPAS